jgi:4-hydroxy-tetrahydrodipicolinate reductase
MIKVAITGCGGQMGRALVQAVAAAEDLQLGAASEAPGSSLLGQDAGPVAGLSPLGVTITADIEAFLQEVDGVIDFSHPASSAALCSECAQRRLPLVVGTTGLNEAQRQSIARAAAQIPLVFAPNTSVGINLLLKLAQDAAKQLGPDFDLEIVEAHHRRKVDAPSGTALRLAEVLAESTAQEGSLAERGCYGRQGAVGPRPAHQIGIHTVRGGDIIGEHTVMFCGEGERLELIHRASSRQTFARGALRALRWTLGQPAGLYDMQDVLGLKG